jgi:hypothetical protein
MMSESHAEHYQKHKDDEGEWGEPTRSPASTRRRLASMISVRFHPDEARCVRVAAAEADESVSNFIRTAALRRCRRSVSTATVSGTPSVVAWADLPVTSGGPTPPDEADWQPDASLRTLSTTR